LSSIFLHDASIFPSLFLPKMLEAKLQEAALLKKLLDGE
jgi:hypothetical protein